MPTFTLSPAVVSRRARYYPFRNARRAIARGDDITASRELAGTHGDYVRRRLAGLPDPHGRIADLLRAAPRVREETPPSNQAAADRRAASRCLAESLGDRLRFAAIEGYWPTPHAVATRMVHLAGLVAGERVLEPSAGSGRLVEAILHADPFVSVDACELAIPCREVLVVKQRYITFDLVGSDFLHVSSLTPYDAVLMHPPHVLATPHVVKAFARHLRPGGRLVALLTDGAVYAGDRESQRLKGLINSHAIDVEGELIPGGIGDPPATAARLYVLRKPA